MSEEQAFCAECGTELLGARFCPECGAVTANARPGSTAGDGFGAATATAVRPAVATVAQTASAASPPAESGGVDQAQIPREPGEPPSEGGPGARFSRRSVIWMAAGAAAIALIVAAVLLLSGGGSSHHASTATSKRTTPATNTANRSGKATLPAVTKGEALALADEYAGAYSAESVPLLRSLFASDFKRKNAGGPTENRVQALATYESQFKGLTNPHYDLSGPSITTGRDTASVMANYRITSSAGTSKGFVVIEMARVNGKLLITYINATPQGGTSSGGSSSTGKTGSSSSRGSTSSSGDSGSSSGGSTGSAGSSSGSSGSSDSSGDGGGLLWRGYELPPPTVPDLY